MTHFTTIQNTQSTYMRIQYLDHVFTISQKLQDGNLSLQILLQLWVLLQHLLLNHFYSYVLRTILKYGNVML